MPGRFSSKIFVENGYYHIFNRGVEKRVIFIDDTDYRTFLYFIKYYLAPPDKKDIKMTKRSLYKEVDLLSYCLMPNHFHLLLKQHSQDGMTKFVRAISTNYVCYFNIRYQRVGTLFQGKYKAVLVDNDPYLLHVSRYIHLNPRKLDRVGPWKGSDPLSSYPYSSYGYYLGLKSAEWIKPPEILNYFQSARKINLQDFLSYESFIENYPEDPEIALGKNLLE